MLKDELLNLRCRPSPVIISELRALLVFVSVIQQTIKRRNGREWGNKENWWRHVVQGREVKAGRIEVGGRQRFHYDSGQNPLKVNLTNDSQREQRLENTAGGVGLPISTFLSMS
ncbi:hypothetical protein ALC53_01963 [Atta colombica]|uniref:Uncharacterized protein n=1 Tax=Atta colombica TaxID=520822 RepID=A0A195BT92_9HYME|nr:hypothetical protein ALC53_01963 [Atta colombica]